MDEGLFKTIYEATHNQLLAYLRHLAGKAQAEDVMQETYIRLLNHPPRKNDPIAQRSWLFTTATRLLRDQWRKDRAFSWNPWSRDGGDSEPPVTQCERLLPDQEAWTRQTVDLGFRALTPRQRTLLWLAHVEGFNHRELGAALGLSPGSARVMLHRARQRMIANLEQHGITGGLS